MLDAGRQENEVVLAHDAIFACDLQQASMSANGPKPT